MPKALGKFHVDSGTKRMVDACVNKYGKEAMQNAVETFETNLSIDHSKFRNDVDRIKYIVGIARNINKSARVVHKNLPTDIVPMQTSTYDWSYPEWMQKRFDDIDNCIEEVENAPKGH